MDRTVQQVYLMTANFDESIGFYEDVIGLEAITKDESRAEFDTGECSLVIEPDFDEETLASFGLEPPGDERGEGVVIVVEVDDVEAVYERARAANVEVNQEPTEVNWGRKLLLLSDPDGYVLEVSRPVADQ